MKLASAVLALLCAAAPLDAAFAQPGQMDGRVLAVDYDPDRVVPIRGAFGYQLMIEFAPQERIENVSIGDALGWQVTPNKRANILFLKPVDGRATNMTVVTDLRRYLFDLRLQPKASRSPPAFTVRFVYPAPAPAILLPEPEREPTVANASYAISGSAETAPARVFDDGLATYFEWPSGAAIPAIFAVASDGSESLVNYGVRGPYVVVQQLAGRFSLRHSQLIATVTNTAVPLPASAKVRKR
jgi:type IV secretion system protein VirB9